MLAAIEGFLSIATQRAEVDPLQQLARSLDRLSLSFQDIALGNQVASGCSHERVVAVRSMALAVKREAIGKAYPELGLYPSLYGVDLRTTEWTVADAIDDIEEIAGDIADALGEYAEGGWPAVEEQLAFWYRAHLWQHIVELRRCLAWTVMCPE